MTAVWIVITVLFSFFTFEIPQSCMLAIMVEKVGWGGRDGDGGGLGIAVSLKTGCVSAFKAR